jgi:acyl-CoA dehydrogenase
MSTIDTAFFDSVERFFKERINPNINAWDEAGEFPKSLYSQAGELGMLALGYPEEFGGVDCSLRDRVRMNDIVCRSGSGGLWAGLFSHNIALPPIIAHGTESLQQRIVPDVLAGRKIAALAITEPGGGSDVANIKTWADRHSDASGDYYLISGEKIFITSGVRADWLTVAVRTGEAGAKGISLLAVDGNSPGITRSNLKKTGWWMSDTASIHFDKVRVPVDQLIGVENKGFRAIMENFNNERLMIAAGAISFARLCLEEATDWAQQRKTFGSKLVEHQVVRHKLMDMRTRVQSADAWLLGIVDRLESGDIDEGLIADICLLKNHATLAMQFCADQAVQILGGMGFMRGLHSERIYREVKVLTIGGGTEEIMKELAARQLGLLS